MSTSKVATNVRESIWYTIGVPTDLMSRWFGNTTEKWLGGSLLARDLRAHALIKNFMFVNRERFHKTVNIGAIANRDPELRDALALLRNVSLDVEFTLLVNPSFDSVLRSIEKNQLQLAKQFLEDNGWNPKLLEYYKLFKHTAPDDAVELTNLLDSYKKCVYSNPVTVPYHLRLTGGAPDIQEIPNVVDVYAALGLEPDTDKKEPKLQTEPIESLLEVATRAVQEQAEEATDSAEPTIAEVARVSKITARSGSGNSSKRKGTTVSTPAVSDKDKPKDRPVVVSASKKAQERDAGFRDRYSEIPKRPLETQLNGKNTVLTDIALNTSIVYVDCDNTNFFIFLAFLRHLEKLRSKRSTPLTIRMFADVRSHPFWEVVPRMFRSVKYTLELRQVEFIKSEKSVVDMSIAVSLTRDVLKGVSNVALMSSDCDYFGAITELSSEANIAVAYIEDFTSTAYLRLLSNLKVPHCDLTCLLQEDSLQSEADRIIRSFALSKFAAVSMSNWSRDTMVEQIQRELQFGQGTEYAEYFSRERIVDAVDATMSGISLINVDGVLKLQANGESIEIMTVQGGVN